MREINLTNPVLTEQTLLTDFNDLIEGKCSN